MQKKKKVLSTVEQVGDTSGFKDAPEEFTKKRKLVLWSSVIGLVLLILAVIFLFTSQKSVTFIYRNDVQNQEAYTINMKTGILDEIPDDPNRSYFTFDGWFLDSKCSNPTNGLDEEDLKSYKFSKIKNTTLYAKWSPIEYTIEYDLVGNKSIYAAKIKKSVTNTNVTSYMVKHEPTETEINDYIEKIRTVNPTKYVTNPLASKYVQEAMTLYNDDCIKGSIKLKSLDGSNVSGANLEFDHWEDSDGNTIESISKLEPKNYQLKAIWK